MTLNRPADPSLAYRQPIDDVLAAPGTTLQHGLSDSEAKSRLQQLGRNALLAHQPIPGVVIDTTIAFGPTSPDLTLELKVPVIGGNRQFDATIEYRNGTTPLFAGAAAVVSHGLNDRGVSATPLAVHYVGPGANATRLTLAPKTLTLEIVFALR